MAQVFVTEDEGEANRIAAAMLERAGHDAGRGALGGAIVLDVEVVDGTLLVFSMVTPKFDGCEVYRAVKHLRPDAPLIAVSFGDTAQVSEGAQRLAPAGASAAETREVWEELIRLTADTLLAAADADSAWDAESDVVLRTGGDISH
jgi:hypothetical protein